MADYLELRLVDYWWPEPARPPVRLTRREWEVLTLLRYRLTDREIAAQLCISTRTVESHVARILGKLGVSSRREAGAIAVRVIGARVMNK